MFRQKTLTALGSLGALVLLLAGCGAFKPSPTWATATSLKVPGKGDYLQSDVYAREVSKQLSHKGIENKVVTFKYNFTDSQSNEFSVTRSSVIYKDESSPNYPWWLVDNLVRLPVWLPNGSIAEQVHFVTHRQPEIVAVTEPKPDAPIYVRTRPVARPWTVVRLLPPPQSESVARAVPVVPQEDRMESIFYRDNGTPYDPASSMNRRKMALLEAGKVTLR